MANEIQLGIDVDATDVKKASDALDGMNTRLRDTKGRFVGAGQGATAFGNAANDAANQTDDMNESLAKTASLMSRLKPLLIGFAGGLFVKDLMSATQSLQQMRMMLTSVTGSTEGMEKQMTYLSSTANKFGLDLMSVGKAYGQLLAAADASNVPLKTTQTLFEGLSATGSTLGWDQGQMDQAMRAFQQMLSKSVVSAEEVSGQLGEVLPGAMAIAAQSMNMSMTDFRKQMELGKISAVELADAMGGALLAKNGAAAESANTTSRAINELGSAMFALKVIVIDSGFAQALGAVFDGLSGLAQSGAAVAAAQALGAAFAILGGLAADLFFILETFLNLGPVAMILNAIAAAAQFLAEHLWLLEAAVVALSAVFAKAFIGGFVAAIAPLLSVGGAVATLSFGVTSLTAALGFLLGPFGLVLLAAGSVAAAFDYLNLSAAEAAKIMQDSAKSLSAYEAAVVDLSAKQRLVADKEKELAEIRATASRAGEDQAVLAVAAAKREYEAIGQLTAQRKRDLEVQLAIAEAAKNQMAQDLLKQVPGTAATSPTYDAMGNIMDAGEGSNTARSIAELEDYIRVLQDLAVAGKATDEQLAFLQEAGAYDAATASVASMNEMLSRTPEQWKAIEDAANGVVDKTAEAAAQIEMIGEAFGPAAKASQEWLATFSEGFTSSIGKMTEGIAVLPAELAKIKEQFAAIGEAKTFEGQAEAAFALYKNMTLTNTGTAELRGQLGAALITMTNIAGVDLAPGMREAVNQLRALNNVMSIGVGIANSLAAAMRGAASAFGGVAGAMARMANMGSVISSAQAASTNLAGVAVSLGGSLWERAKATAATMYDMAESFDAAAGSAGGGGGGGGGMSEAAKELEDALKLLQAATEAGMTTQEKAAKEAKALADAQALVQAAVDAGSISLEQYDIEMAKVNQRYNEIAYGAVNVADAIDSSFNTALDSAGDALADMFSGGLDSAKGFADSMMDIIKTMLADILKAIVNNQIIVPIKAMISGGGAGGGGFLSSIFGGGAGGGGFMSSLTSGLTSTFKNLFSGGIGSAFEGMSTALAGATSSLSGFAGALGAVAGPVGLAIGAVSLISSLFKTTKTILNAGYIAKVNSPEDIGVKEFQKIRKEKFMGLVSDTSIKTSGAGQAGRDLAAMIRDIVASVYDSAEILGLSTDAFDGFFDTAREFRLGLKGLSSDERESKITQWLNTIGSQLVDFGTGAMDLSDALAEAALDGESTYDTFMRLGQSLKVVNLTLEALSATLLPENFAGGLAAGDLTAKFGGLEEFAKSVQNYADLFLTEAEQMNLLRNQLEQAADAKGITEALPQTALELRAMVEGLDLMTESGRNMYAFLVGNASAFDKLFDSLGDGLNSIKDLESERSDILKELTSRYWDLINAEKALGAARDSLAASDLAPGTEMDQLAELRRQFNEAATLAQGGDTEAAIRAAQLAQQVLQQGQTVYGSSTDYGALFREINAALIAAQGGIRDTASVVKESLDPATFTEVTQRTTNQLLVALAQIDDRLAELNDTQAEAARKAAASNQRKKTGT